MNRQQIRPASQAMRQPLSRGVPGALTALALGFAISSSHAHGGGQALDIELPSMRTPIEAQQPLVSQPQTADASIVIVGNSAPLPQQARLSRAEVRESLKMARLSNTMTPSGEIGDTPEVLQAREDFYALQTEVLQAQYAAAAQRQRDEQQAVQQARDSQPVSAADPAVSGTGQQVIVAPDMTVGELMSFLQDSPVQGTVVVMLPNEDEQEED